MKRLVLYCLLAAVSTPCNAVLLGVDEFDMISISADEAEEDERPGILHLKGHFLMQSSDWRLTSTQATVYGSPDRPDRVRLEGSPARFHVRQEDSPEQELVEAAAMVVEYVRATSTLRLSGNATLVLDREVIQSAVIEYDIETRRYRAGGEDGVLITVPPDGSAPASSPLVRH
jgi:lipopolysaccharide transport protein LptA